MTSQNLLPDEVIDENIPNLIENNNSEEQFKQENNTSLLSPVVSATEISNNSDLSTTNDSTTIENSSLGKKLKTTITVEDERWCNEGDISHFEFSRIFRIIL
jgi:hypothetical protein